MMKQKLKKICLGGVLFFVLPGLSGCGDGDTPFQYSYTSPNDVEIVYQGKVYRLNRLKKLDDTPFEYQFEPDGDVDITIDGKTYDIDSPYDTDQKIKKKTARKTTSKRTTKKKR